MKTPKISVIMPIYNVEEYLEDALNCLLNQSMLDDMEVIMVDDGSTDDSRYIIEKYALDYDNFYAYHKENEGLSLTRNFGIDLAKGEYIHFYDSDDNVAYNGYEKLYDMAKKNDSDIVTSYGVRLRPYAILDSYLFKRAYAHVDSDIDCINFDENPSLLWDMVVWNKLYKREFIEKNNLRFPAHMLYEDFYFGLKGFTLTDKISLTKDLFYYWRVRSGETKSITQQHDQIDNFRDRMKMLKCCHEILNESKFNDECKNELYFKWIDYDMPIYLNLFNKLDPVHYQEIFDKINALLNIIPQENMEKLSSTKKIMYEMIKNNDIGSLIYFTSKHNEIKNNPHIPEELDEKYSEILDLEKDSEFEELIAKGGDTSYDEENIYLEFSEKINYLSDEYPHETIVKLIDSNDNEYLLELDDERKIIIPTRLIKDKSHMRIKVEYITENFKKESFLTNKKREVIEFDQFDVELGKEENLVLFINIRPTDDLNIAIQNVIFEEDIFKFSGTSNKKITTAYIENIVTTDKIEYPVDCIEENNDKFNIEFEIPYKDILSNHVRKWELKVGEHFKTIKVNKRYEFYKNHNKLYFINTRNKVLISDDFHNALDTLKEYNEDILNLKKDKNKLTKTNKSLKTENNEIKNENKTLFDENKSLFNENKSLFNENKSLFNENKSVMKINEKLNVENKSLTEENTNVKVMNEEFKNKNADLINVKTEFERLNKELSDENTQYKAKNETLTANNKELTAENQEVKANNETLTAQNTKYKTKNEELTAENQEVKANNEILTANNKELTAENQEVKANNETLTAQNTEYKTKNEELTAENQEVKANNESLHQKYEKAKLENIEITKTLGKTIDEKDEMEKIIEEYESRFFVKSVDKVRKIF